MGQHPGIFKLLYKKRVFISLKKGGSTSPEWWVNINRNGGSTWSGIYTTVIIYLALAFLFQPFIKVALGRTIWNIVDVVVSIGLIISIFWKSKRE